MRIGLSIIGDGMSENTYELNITEWIHTQYSTMPQYNITCVGIPKFECHVETNDIDILNEINQLLLDYAEKKRKERLDELERSDVDD